MVWIHGSFWFIISTFLRRNDIADVAWGLGFMLLSIWLFASTAFSSVATLLYILVIAWAFRLSLHIFLRNLNKKEDFRYLKWRQEWGQSFFWRSYLQVFLLQSMFLLVISLPLFWAAAFPAHLSVFTWIGLSVWSIGFLFQSIADHQLSEFKKEKSGGIMQRGLWKYSRHPNYLGEIIMWWGIFIAVLPLPYSYLAMASPLAITILLVFVSGVPMLEKKYEHNPAYQAYKKHTWALIPKLW